jgi:hypothetical protein
VDEKKEHCSSLTSGKSKNSSIIAGWLDFLQVGYEKNSSALAVIQQQSSSS